MASGDLPLQDVLLQVLVDDLFAFFDVQLGQLPFLAQPGAAFGLSRQFSMFFCRYVARHSSAALELLHRLVSIIIVFV